MNDEHQTSTPPLAERLRGCVFTLEPSEDGGLAIWATNASGGGAEIAGRIYEREAGEVMLAAIKEAFEA